MFKLLYYQNYYSSFNEILHNDNIQVKNVDIKVART